MDIYYIRYLSCRWLIQIFGEIGTKANINFVFIDTYWGTQTVYVYAEGQRKWLLVIFRVLTLEMKHW